MQNYILIIQKRVQNKFDKARIDNCVENTLINQLLIVFIIINLNQIKCNDENKRMRYQNVLIKTLQWRNKKYSYKIHDIIKTKRNFALKKRNDINKKSRRFWALSIIKRNAHVILVDEKNQIFYINNFIDWEIYNTFYRDDWKQLKIKQTKKIAKQFETKKIEKKKRLKHWEKIKRR